VPRARKQRRGAARYLAPAAFLLAVTIAVLLIRSGLNGGSSGTTTTTTTGRKTVTQPTTTAAATHTTGKTTAGTAQYYTVQAGDTFGSISAKTGVSITQLEQLNPGVSSNSLRVGQRLRVK